MTFIGRRVQRRLAAERLGAKRLAAKRLRPKRLAAKHLAAKCPVARFFVALLVACLAPSGACAASFDYLYVEPSVGSSSGGHVAVRFDDEVYDFQNAPLDTLRLRRDPYEYFVYVYSVVENRPIHVARIEVSDATKARLRDRFNTRYLIQERHFATLDGLREDRELLALLLARQHPSRSHAQDRLPLRGVGLFFPDDSEAQVVAPSPVVGALRERIEAKHGRDFLAQRARTLESEMSRLEPDAGTVWAAHTLRADELPATTYLFSERVRDLAVELAALRVLTTARPLRRDARRVPGDDTFALDAAERRGLAAFATNLESRLVDLVVSKRPDWGFALLLGIARLEVIHASLASGRLVLLDAFPDDAEMVPAASVRRQAIFWSEILTQERASFDEARGRLVAAEMREADFTRIEEAGNRVLEIQGGLDGARPVRLHDDALLPARAGALPELPLPRLDATHLRRAEARAVARERAQVQALQDAFGYDLLRHNCVSEIFATIEAELGRDGSERELGGYVAPTGSLDFIPPVSFRAVRSTYRSVTVGEIPSYRHTRIETMYATENDLAVALRESNTITSTIYRPNERDSFFVFFTDDRVVTRPLYGAINTAAGVGQMALGLLRAPLDRGRTLLAGVRGFGFSLPELLFVSVRKGTLEYGPTDPPRTALRMAATARR